MERADLGFATVPFIGFLWGKHKQYGPGPLLRWGPLGMVMRIDCKWERWKNLTANPELDDQVETVDDQLKDIIGYCVLGLRYQRGQLQ